MSTINVLDATGATVAINTPNADGQATMANSRPVVIASDQSIVPVNQAGVSASGNVTTLNANLTSGVPTANSTVELALLGASGYAISVRGTWTGTIQFQGTVDDANWFTLASIPAGSAANVASVTSTTANGQWIGNASGLLKVRATISAAPTGTANLVLRAMQATGLTFNLPSGQTTQPVSGSIGITGTLPAIVGQAAHDAVLAGNPVRVAGRAVTANYAAVASGDVADLVSTLVGAQVMKLYCIPEAEWATTLALTAITDVAVQTAAGAGLKRHVTLIQATNTGASAVDVLLRDGTTTRLQITIPAGQSVVMPLPTGIPLTANTALNVQLSVTGTVRFNALGYTAP